MATSLKSFGRTARVCLGLLLSLFFLAPGCGQQAHEPTGGETHFLARCSPTSTACGSGLSCLCGVCTLPCAARSACQALPDAACVASSSGEACGESTATGHCDVACAGDDDCAALSAAHRCEAGACRAGPAAPSACIADVAANEVLLVGDSFFASSHQVTAYLEAIARSAAALPAGERYRDNSRLTENALALGGSGIASQYGAGLVEAPVQIVIMSGGGADVLLGSCDRVDATCPVIADAAAAARDLLAKMAADGVRHVVYVFYPDPVDAAVRAKVDALRPLIQEACGASPPCRWLDLRPSFAGRYDELIQPDGLNPTARGSQVTAQAIWEVVQEACDTP